VKLLINALAGRVAISVLKAVRHTDPDRLAERFGRFMRRLGPWLPEHRVGLANLAAAYPEKSAKEIERILAEVWDNLGRMAAEFIHLDRLWDYHPSNVKVGRVELSDETARGFMAMRDGGKSTLVFCAHLGNWELQALTANTFGFPGAALYRAPNVGDVAEAVQEIRSTHIDLLIPTNRQAPFALASAIKRGFHIGILVDQHFGQGIDVEFFGRRCKANPMVARLARQFECPIRGVRTIRLPQHRFRLEITEEVTPPRDRDGKIDVAATMQAITGIVEGWVREYPEQWLWLHRRWRD
jgi:KDO2-lipid IV(A) lauroyltransferase